MDDNLTTIMFRLIKSGGLNHLEPSGTVTDLHSDCVTLLDGGGLSTSRSGPFTPEKRTRYILYRWVG